MSWQSQTALTDKIDIQFNLCLILNGQLVFIVVVLPHLLVERIDMVSI